MTKTLLIALLVILAIACGAGIRALVIARSRPAPEAFNRQTNNSPEDLQRFLKWLFGHTVSEVRQARGDGKATRGAWIRYFQRGLKAGMSLDELMEHLPDLFKKADYPDGEAQRVLAMLKSLTLSEIGIQQQDAGVK